MKGLCGDEPAPYHSCRVVRGAIGDYFPKPMSINLENPETVLGKVDAAANCVAQIRIAMALGDKSTVLRCVEQAERLLFNAQAQLEGQ